MDTQTPGNGILIFLPGVNEIRQCVDAVKKASQGYSDVQVLPLHANLSNEEQHRIFKPTDGWKVIAATNVAEACHLFISARRAVLTYLNRHLSLLTMLPT